MRKLGKLQKSLVIIMSLVFVGFSSSIFATDNVDYENRSYIIYKPEEMAQHKQKCMQEMQLNPLNAQDPSYQMSRALRTIAGDDADYIPKVVGAGEIFTDEPVAYQRMHNGIKIIVNSYYDTQWLTDVIYGLKGHHEPQEEKCFYEILKYLPEDATMIELGSYWAYYSLWFSSEIKNAKNYLIEPDPKRLELGKKNFTLNHKTGVFRRGYIGTAKDLATRDLDPNISGAESISMDDFIEREGIDHVHILHSDIQGAEYDMLTSIVNSLNKIDYFVISTHCHETSHLPCLEFLKTHGFIILAEHTHWESCSGDGLVVAKRSGIAGPERIPIRVY